MLPEPTFTFTIPSICDDINLDCRIYNPPHSVLNPLDGEPPWNPRGAIVAHPYAPFGGCYDDWVVLSVAAEIWKQGFVVGTFNFRGAGSSKGRTSWQGKAETEDYSSFIGFFVHYIEKLTDCGSQTRLHGALDSVPSSIPLGNEPFSQPPSTIISGMKLIIGGYSYGSLITKLLPSTEDVLQRFAQVNEGTAEAEIRLRAISLAAQWNKDAVLYREAHQVRKTRSHEKLRVSAHAMALVMGGDESKLGSRRASHEGRKSLDAVRKSMERSRKKLLRQHSSEVSEHTLVVESLVPVDIPAPQTHYLLISLLQPPISMFATMFSSLRSGYLAQREAKFLDHPTLLIYGDRDVFASQRKLRRWAESLKSKPDSTFQFFEVAGAGHFWREEGIGDQMRGYIRKWIQHISDSPTHYY